MVRRVADACERSLATEVVIATDYQPIADVFHDSRKSTALMTRSDHASGTDRVAEVAQVKKWSADSIVVNVQGDEPQIPPAVIDQVAQLLQSDPRANVATLCTPITSLHEFLDPNVVKVVSGADGAALYFSRAPIPWNRDSAGTLTTQREFPQAFRHLGIYAYRVGALMKLTKLAPTSLEQVEKLEQLRALQAGMRILVAQAIEPPGLGVDTLADLERVRTTQRQNT